MKYIKLGFYLLTAILCVVVIGFMYFGSEENAGANFETGAGFGLTLAGILGVACALGWIVFGVIQLIDNPAKLKSAGIFLGSLLVLFIIGYIFSSGDLPANEAMLEKYNNNGVTTESGSHMIGALLNLPIILGGLAIIMIVASEVKKAIS